MEELKKSVLQKAFNGDLKTPKSSSRMNEAETRAELIDPKLKACGWGVVEGSKILRERSAQITDGKIQVGGGRAKHLIADYILVYKGIKLAVVEAKSDELEVGEGVAQAKLYAEKLNLETTYSTNGKEIYSICMKTGKEGLVDAYLSPDELWDKTYAVQKRMARKVCCHSLRRQKRHLEAPILSRVSSEPFIRGACQW